MRNSIIRLHKRILYNNRGSGLGVILYGITLLLILIFTAINIVNSKVIENGYNSLRDAVQTASSGAVIHLLTSERSESQGATAAQNDIIGRDSYDIYLQLALGYLINREPPEDRNDDTIVQTGEINNFIKLDYQKVVNTTLALLEDAVIRRHGTDISDTNEYKIMMFFIEPYQDANNQKFFNVIAYGNGDYKKEIINGNSAKNIQKEIAIGLVKSDDSTESMKDIYEDVEDSISSIVNCTYDGMSEDDKEKYTTETSFNINLNSRGSSDYDQLIREMETYPHYVIVVKDFALPTIFDGTETNDEGAGVKGLFTSLSGDGRLKTPMCALNTGKVQRQVEDAGWSQNR